MYLTEEQAQLQDCIGPQSCGQVIDRDNKTRRVCKGSACGMGWRWGVENKFFPLHDEQPEGLGRMEDVLSLTHGYCGLAGVPPKFGPWSK